MSAIVVNSQESLSKLLGDVREAWQRHKYLRVTIKTGRDRTIDQNAISHVWYEQVAKELREDDALGVKRFCKLHFGVPILRANDADFRDFYDAGLKGLTYEQKIKAMDYLPVTSLMTTAQLSAYCVEMQDHYRKFGVILEFPELAPEKARKAA
jgi:hypothetical protein